MLIFATILLAIASVLILSPKAAYTDMKLNAWSKNYRELVWGLYRAPGMLPSGMEYTKLCLGIGLIWLEITFYNEIGDKQ